ncbi:hypothetical protein D3C84_1237800 [compost metagenome]
MLPVGFGKSQTQKNLLARHQFGSVVAWRFSDCLFARLSKGQDYTVSENIVNRYVAIGGRFVVGSER